MTSPIHSWDLSPKLPYPWVAAFVTNPTLLDQWLQGKREYVFDKCLKAHPNEDTEDTH